MRQRKGLLALLTLILAVSMFLTACGGNNSNNNESANNNGGNNQQQSSNDTNGGEEEAPKEVEFTIGYAPGDPAGRQAHANMIEAFMEAYPHITVKDITDTSSGSYLDWLKTKDAVGEYPDLVELRDVQTFVEAGRAAELPEELHGLFKDLPDFEGKYYVAPMTGNPPLGIIYSKQAYEDAGITELPQNYDEFLEIQQKLKDSGISPIVVGGKDVWHMGFWINKFLGDYVLGPDPNWNSKKIAKETSFTDDNVVQAMTDFKELFQNYVDDGWLSTADNQTASVLISGKAAQLFSGPWMFGQIEEADPNFEFGFYVIPDREGELTVNGASTLAGWSMSVEAVKDPDKKAAMTEYIKFFFEPENYAKHLEALNALPTTKAEVSYEASEQFEEVLKIVNDPTPTRTKMINNFWGENKIPTQFRDWFYKLMQEMVLEDGDVVEYMQRADAEFDSLVEATSK